MKARKWNPQLNCCPENCLFKNVVTSLWMYGGAPSCQKTFGLISSSWEEWSKHCITTQSTKNFYFWAAPYVFFNNGVRLFNLPHTKLKCFFPTHTECWEECFVFCNTINHVHARFKMYHPITSVNVLQNLQSVIPQNSLLSAIFFKGIFHMLLHGTLNL